jgi:hypothetical protein
MKRKGRQRRKPRENPSLLDRINLHVAGIDCGSERHYVAVPSDHDPEPVRSFATFTGELMGLEFADSR